MIAWFAAAHADDDYRSYVDQARFFLKKGWTDDAREQLERAVATEDGRLDPEAWMLLAKVAYEGHDLARCRFAADRALVQSRTDDQARQAGELLEFVDAQFGVVVVHGPQDGSTARLRLELTSLQLDPDLAAWTEAVAAQVSKPVVLPFVLGLPAGDYTVNGAPFTVIPGGHGEITPPVAGVDFRSVSLELTLSGTQLLGSRAADLLPSPTAGVGVWLPAGAFQLGLEASGGAQPYRTPTGAQVGAAAAGSLHGGVVVPGTRGVLVRPGVFAEVSRPAGFGAPCAVAVGGGFACGADAPAEQLFVFVSGLGLGAGGEVTVALHDRRRARSVGLGLRLQGGATAVRLPGAGRVDTGAGAVSFTLEVDDRQFVVGRVGAGLIVQLGL